MRLVLLVAIFIIFVTINLAALLAGHERNKLIHNLATLFGGIGLFCILCLLVAFADAFTQIWVKRPGYEGQPVVIFFGATVATTLGSLAAIIAVVLRDRASEA